MKAPRVTLDQWRTLQAVVDHGGFAQAAEAMHRSQSSISYTVARMQEQLGVLLREEVLSGVEEALVQGHADLAISGLNIAGHLGADLSVVDFVAVAHPDHPLHRLQREITHQDLETQMQVVIRDSGRLQPRDVGWLGAEQRWTVGSLATAATFVSNGLGFAWLPRHMIERELKDGVLKPLPLTQGGVRESRFYLYPNKEKPLGPATQILVELLTTFASVPLDAHFAAPDSPA